MALQGPPPASAGKDARSNQALLTQAPDTYPSGESDLPGAWAKLSGAQKLPLLAMDKPSRDQRIKGLAQGHIANQGLSWEAGLGPLISKAGLELPWGAAGRWEVAAGMGIGGRPCVQEQ